MRLFLVFPLQLFDKLLPLCCLAHPHHHQALVIPFRYHRCLGAENKGNLSGTAYTPAPLSITHTRSVPVGVRKVVHSSVTPEKSGTVQQLPGLQRRVSFATLFLARQGVGQTGSLKHPLAAGATPCSLPGKCGLPRCGWLFRMTSLLCRYNAGAQSPAYTSSVIKANTIKKKIITPFCGLVMEVAT